ncbi:MAG: sugar phosphate nucleotidyltransferase [Acidimicrobiia bacterium]
MKVVLFCGGEGLRLRDFSGSVPKPMVPVGYRPIMWHVMKYYAQYGHKDFILCLGHHADVIKHYFLNYEEAVSNDFVLREGGKTKQMLQTDVDDWTITFVDTGLNAEIGERLLRVREHLSGEEVFLANYADGLTDLDLDTYLAAFGASGRTGALLAVKPTLSYHVVSFDETGSPIEIGPIRTSGLWLNGGYFVFRQGVFSYLEKSDDLAVVLSSMVDDGELFSYPHEGFWAPMDTFKDKSHLDAIWASGRRPWLRSETETG